MHSLGFRPRGPMERLDMARVIASAPAVVEVQGDDGWAAACLAVSGRWPVAGPGCDLPRMHRTLHRLGLPRPARALPAATVTAELRLDGDAEPGQEPLPPVDGPLVDLVIRGAGRGAEATVHAAERQAWPVRIHLADGGPVTLTGEAVMFLDEGDLLAPGAVRALAHALFAHPAWAGVWGDSLLIDAETGVPHRWLPASTLPTRRVFQVPTWRPPALVGATLVRRARLAGLTAPCPLDLLERLVAAGPVGTVPLPVHHRLERAERIPPVAVRPRLVASGPRARAEAAPPPTDALVVVDDGDVGALEHCLEQHAAGRAVWVDLEVPRDPLDVIRAAWSGEYTVHDRLQRWVTHTGPVHLRLSSAPEWAPPPVRGVGDLPDLPAPDALLALAAALDWPFPVRTRGIQVKVAHPVARAMVQARLAIRKDRVRNAVNPLSQVLKLAPEWRLGWQVAAEVFDTLGYANEAASCRRQALNCRAA